MDHTLRGVVSGLCRTALLILSTASVAHAAPATYVAHAWDLEDPGRSCAAQHHSGDTPQTAVCSGPPGQLSKSRSFTGGVGVYAEMFGDPALHSRAVAAEALFQDLWTLGGPRRMVTANMTFRLDGTHQNGAVATGSLDLHPLLGGGGATPGGCEVGTNIAFLICSTVVVFDSLTGMELTMRASASAQPGVLDPLAHVIADFYNTAHLTSLSFSDAGGAISFGDVFTASGGQLNSTGYVAAQADVPEPASAALACLALLGALGARRRPRGAQGRRPAT